MNISINSNINFNGFTNIVTLSDFDTGRKRVSYIAAKLDNVGEPDLDKYHKIREQQGLLANKENDTVATFFYVADRDKGTETLYFHDKRMFWGDELCFVRDECVPDKVSAVDYKREEALHMKIYTLLASLTKRMSNENFNNEGSGLHSVLECLYENLNKIAADQKEAIDLLRCGCLKLEPFQELAADFNKAVVNTMKQFFK